MEALSAISFLLFIIILIVGLIRPSVFSKFKIGTRKKVLLVSTAFFILFMVLLPDVPTDKKAVTKEQIAEPTMQQPTAKKTPTNQPTKPAPKEESIHEKIWKNLDTSIKTREGYNVSYKGEDKSVILTLNKDEFWDENELVRVAYTDFVVYGKEVFKNPEVESLTTIVNTKFTDTYGKEKTDIAVKVGMSRETFKKFDWDNLEYVSVYRQMELEASEHYIHPAILKSVDTEKLYLKST